MATLTGKKHLFFDLDDTLWDFEKNSHAVLQRLFAEFNLAHKLKTGFAEFYTAYKTTNLQLWAMYYQRQIDKAYLRNHRFNLVFQLFNYDNFEENLVITERYLAQAPHGKLLKEDCLPVLSALKQHFSLHIITNGFKEAQSVKLDNCGLLPYFSTVIISEEHQLLKPDEKIFRLAESLSGALQHECVMIGDNLECDVKGAINAGWEAIHVSELKPSGFSGHSVSRLSQLKPIFGV